MSASETTKTHGYCKSCGAPLGPDTRFCRSCGTARPDAVNDAPANGQAPTAAQAAVRSHTGEHAQRAADPSSTSPIQPVADSTSPQGRSPAPPRASPQPGDAGPAPLGFQPSPQPGYQAAPSGYQSPSQPHYPATPPGYQQPPVDQQGYAGPPPGYQTPPPGYANPAAGYPVAQGPAPLSRQPEHRSTPSRWLIGGIAAAVVAIVGVGVAVVLAAGGSSTPTKLVAAPVVTASPSTSTTPASPATPPSPSTHPPTSSSPAPAAPKALTPRVPIPQQLGQEQSVSNTIHQEFALITEHKFSAAYALLAPSLQTGEEGWVDSHREEGIYNVSVATTAAIHSPESATANIVKMRTLDGGGCKSWTGSWNLIKIDGQWRISEANLTPESC
jgi:hypothetical protein